MPYYAGLDISLDMTSVCVVDGEGGILVEASVPTDPTDIAAFLTSVTGAYERVTLEAMSLAYWIHDGLRAAGLPAICIEARHAHRILGARANKTDRNDAHGLAEIARTGLFKVVHVKSAESSHIRGLLTARKLLQTRAIGLENGIGGILRVYGLKLRKVKPGAFERQVRGLLELEPSLAGAIEPLLDARGAIRRAFNKLDRELAAIAKADPVCRRLMTAPGVGSIVAVTYRSVIDRPERFKRSRDVGPHLGMTPRTAQSGKMEWRGGITRWGDRGLRTALFHASLNILNPRMPPCPLRTWALALVSRRGGKRALVAIARRLAVVLHRMWSDGTDFRFGEAGA
jgi:transposase